MTLRFVSGVGNDMEFLLDSQSILKFCLGEMRTTSPLPAGLIFSALLFGEFSRTNSCFSAPNCRKRFVDANDTRERSSMLRESEMWWRKACFKRWTLWNVFMERNGNLFVFEEKSKGKVYRAKPSKGGRVPWHEQTKESFVIATWIVGNTFSLVEIFP